MFRKLRLKLTLVNIAVVGVILLLFLSGIYIFMSRELEKQSYQFMMNTAMQSRNPDRPDSARNEFGNWSNCFFIRVNSTGIIINQSQQLPVSEDDLIVLLEQAQSAVTDKGLIKINSGDFRYQIIHPPSQGDQVYVFLNMQYDNAILLRLQAVLISIGLSGLIIVFFVSIFLADRALIPINQAWERQRNFTADASHELRSPLTVIQTNLEVVIGNKEESVESQLKWLENIQTENKRMAKLVSDLLFLARADSDQQLVDRKFFPISEALEEVVSIYKPIAEKKEIIFHSAIIPKIEYFGDESRIKQLVVILIDNAIKYTNPDGHVKLELNANDSQLDIVVSDDGEGIEEEHLDKIFERFYRVDKARSRESGGTGLGLSIADWIVKGHRGTINVSSLKDNGTTFRITLPRLLPRKQV